MENWIKVEHGIRYREHPTRRHGARRRPDSYYVIRLAVDGMMRQEALGWEGAGRSAGSTPGSGQSGWFDQTPANTQHQSVNGKRSLIFP